MLFKTKINEKKDVDHWRQLNALPKESYCENITQKNVFSLKVKQSDMIVGRDVMADIEMTHSYDGQTDCSTVWSVLSQFTHSFGGKLLCKQLLLNPMFNIDTLKERVRCLEELENKNSDRLNKKTIVTDPGYEQELLWFFEEKEETIESLLSTVFINLYGISNTMNNNETCLTSSNIYRIIVSPTIGLLSPLIYVVIPFLIIKYKMGNIVKMSFWTYLKILYKSITKSRHMFDMLNRNTSGLMHKVSVVSYIMSFIFYFQGLFNTFALSQTTYKVAQYITEKAMHSINQLRYYVDRIEFYDDIISKYQGVFLDEPITDTPLKHTITYLKQFDINKSKFSIFSNFGRYLKFYKNFNKTDIIALLNQFYFVDCLEGFMKIKQHKHLTYAQYLSSDEQGKPNVTMKKAWHIALDNATAVPNDLSSDNIVLTGPNAGGKSTIIKTFIVNVLLAQTVGLTSSVETHLTPFYFVNTQINIPDCKGKESLFEAEMNRCMFTLETLKTIVSKPSLIVMDEIFNSTNMIEAVAGAFSILTELSKNKTCLIYITTHFLYLTRLSKTSNFKNKKMNVQIDSTTNKMHYPYLLSDGISRQYIALDLLKNKGFDQNIIEDAIKIKNKFIKSKPPSK